MPTHRIITRREYMSDKAIGHEEYFSQFVTEDTIRHVARVFDEHTLREALSADPHLNTIPLPRWDALSIHELNGPQGKVRSSGPFRAVIPFDRTAAVAAGEAITRATLVCIAKCAARMIVRRDTRLAA